MEIITVKFFDNSLGRVLAVTSAVDIETHTTVQRSATGAIPLRIPPNIARRSAIERSHAKLDREYSGQSGCYWSGCSARTPHELLRTRKFSGEILPLGRMRCG